MKRFNFTAIAFNSTGVNWFKFHYKVYKFNKNFTINKTLNFLHIKFMQEHREPGEIYQNKPENPIGRFTLFIEKCLKLDKIWKISFDGVETFFINTPSLISTLSTFVLDNCQHCCISKQMKVKWISGKR